MIFTCCDETSPGRPWWSQPRNSRSSLRETGPRWTQDWWHAPLRSWWQYKQNLNPITSSLDHKDTLRPDGRLVMGADTVFAEISIPSPTHQLWGWLLLLLPSQLVFNSLASSPIPKPATLAMVAFRQGSILPKSQSTISSLSLGTLYMSHLKWHERTSSLSISSTGSPFVATTLEQVTSWSRPSGPSLLSSSAVSTLLSCVSSVTTVFDLGLKMGTSTLAKRSPRSASSPAWWARWAL